MWKRGTLALHAGKLPLAQVRRANLDYGKSERWVVRGRKVEKLGVRRRRFRILEGFIWLLSLTVMGLVGFAVWESHASPGGKSALERFREYGEFLLPNSNPFGSQKTLTILLLGTDETNNLCDTVILSLVNLQTQRVALISIPRDSVVTIPGKGRDKLTHVFPQGMERSHRIEDGMDLVRRTIEKTLGISIDNAARIDVKGFIRLVDIVGGVDMDVEKRMVYRDRSQDLYIDLQPGFQHLDGYQAMGYVRFRHDAQADLARVERQRKFMAALLDQFNQVAGQGRWDAVKTAAQVVPVLEQTASTDLTPAQLRYLVDLARKMSPESVESATAEGAAGMVGGLGSVYQLDMAAIQRTIVQFWGALEERNPPHQVALVEILNGCGSPGIAEEAKGALEHKGFRVVRTGNADRFDHIRSEVHYAPGSEDAARLAARTLHLPEDSIRSEKVGSTGADIQVVLGKNFTTLGLPRTGLSATF